jgi:hypothetical protein
MGIVRVSNSGVLVVESGAVSMSQDPIPPPELPFLANVDMHYDFSDLSTLWQDEAGTMQASTNGDSIARIDDTGTRGLNLLSSGGTTPVVLDSVSDTFAVGSTVDAVGVLHALIDINFVPPQTAYVVWNSATLPTLTQFFQCQSTLSMQFRTQTNGNRMIAYNSNNNRETNPNAPPQIDTWYAAIVMGRDTNSQVASFSASAGSDGGANQTTTTWDTTKRMLMFANNTGGGNPFRGRIAEAGVYDIDDSDEPTIFAEIEAYITDKFGIVWA